MHKRLVPSLLAAATALFSARAAVAADCTSLGFGHIVYMTGSSAAKGLLSQVGKVLASNSPPVTLIYVSSGSCNGVTSVLGSQTPVMALATDANPPTYWNTVGTELTCDISTPVQADVGISDVFADTCLTLPGGLGSIVDNKGPVQAMTFAVPNSSNEKSISAEAAYMIFGFGNASGVAPWVDETSMFVRSVTSGTLQMIAAAIGVQAPQPPGVSKWKGIAEANSTAVLSALTAANASGGATAAKAIGILSVDVVDANRLTVHELAYQHYRQNCGWLPDSSAAKFDKANVRDGHYAIWGPIHLLQRDDAHPAEATFVKLAVDYATGAQDPPGVDLIQFEATSHVIPQCAMRVQRSTEMGQMTPFQASKPCGCYYEYTANLGSTTCDTCSVPTDCSAGFSCQTFAGMGFCEPS